MEDDFARSVSDAFRSPQPFGAPGADWDDLSNRIERRHRRQRNILAGCAVLVAMATGASGYALGNHGGGTLTVKSDSPSSAGGSGTSGGNKSSASPMIADAPGAISSGGTVSSGMGFEGSGLNATKLISRRTAAGLEIRSWRSSFGSGPSAQLGNPQNLPAECIATGNVMFAVISDDDVVQNGIPATEATRPITTLSSQVGMTGTVPILSVTVTSVDEASVRATFPDGTVDSMSPVDHTVILAASASADDVKNWSRTRIEFTASDGTTREVTADSVNVMTMIDLSPMPTDTTVAATTQEVTPQLDCSPRLPAPGEQPADAGAAHDAVVSAFTRLYDPAVPDDQKLGLVDDPAGVQDGWNAARTGPYAEAAKGSKFRLQDLVFTAPDAAGVKYDILLPDGSTPIGSLIGQIGSAHLVDGTWKVTRESICSVLSMAGGGCTGDPAGTGSSGSSGFAGGRNSGVVTQPAPAVLPAGPATSTVTPRQK